MKKHISLLLALMMLFTMLPMGMTAVSAEGITVTQSATDLDATTEDVIDISTLQSEITLTFGSEPSTTEGIAFTKADGTAITGAVVGTAATDGLTYTLEFGRLEAAADYKLVVPAAVTDGEEAVFSYKAVEPTEKKIEFTAEEGFTVGETFPADKGIIDDGSASIVADGTTQVMRVKAPSVEASKTYGPILQLSSSWTGTGNGAYNTGIDDRELINAGDVYVIDVAMKPSITQNGTNCSHTGFTLTPCAANATALNLPKNGAITANSSQMVNASSTALAATDGWYNVRAVLREDGKISTWTDKWQEANMNPSGTAASVTMDLYDATEGGVKYIDSIKGGTISGVGFRVISLFVAQNQEVELENYVDIAHIYAKRDRALTVLKTDGYTKANKSVVFHMSDDIDATTVSTIKVTNENDEEVNGFIAQADNTNRTITVSFPDGMASAGEYKVDLSSVFGTNNIKTYNGLYTWVETTDDEGTTTGAYSGHENLAVRTFTVAEDQIAVENIVTSSAATDSNSDGVFEISTLLEEITLTFSTALTDEQAANIDEITITGTQEKPFKGLIIPSINDDKTEVTLKFGRLADAGTYTLTVPTSVTGNDAAKVFTYLATEGARVDVNTEFGKDDGFVEGQAPTDKRTSSSKTGLRYHYGDQRYDFSTPNYNSAQNMTVIADGTDDQALELAPKKVTADDGTVTYYGAELGVNAHGQFRSILSEDRDVYVIDAAVKSYASEDTEVASPERNVFIPTRSDFLHGGSLGLFAVGNVLKTQKLSETAANGVEIGAGSEWKKVRAVIRDNGTLGYYSVTPSKPKYVNDVEQTGTNLAVTPHQKVDIYDATETAPKYIGEVATRTAEDYAYTIARIVKPTTDTGLNSRIAVDYVYARKDKAMTVLEADTAYTKDNKKLVFYMTDDIDAASKDNVVVKLGDAVISDRTVSVNEAERSLTIEFAGLVAGDYTVDLRGVMGTNGVGVWNGKYEWDTTYPGTDAEGYVHQNLAIYSFDVSAADGAFVVSGVTSGEEALGNTLDADAGELTIAFSSALADGAEEYITLTKANGTRIGGIVVKNVDGNNVTLKFGRLEEGEDYKLDIPAAVTSADGAAVIAKSYTFTATREYEVQNDFSSFADNDALSSAHWNSASDPSSSIISKSKFSADLSTGRFGVVLDGVVTAKKNGEDTYLELKPEANAVTYNNAGMYLVARASETEGYATLESNYFKTGGQYRKEGYVLAMDASVRAQAVNPETTYAYNAVLFGSFNNTRLAMFSGGAVADLKSYYYTTQGGVNVSPAYKFNTIDANSFNKARQVVSAAKAEVVDHNDLNYKLYDLDNGKYVGKQADPSKVAWYAYTRLVEQKVSDNVGTNNAKIDLTDFAVFYAKAMDVLATEFDAEELKLTIWLTDEIDAATASKAIITTGEGDSLTTLDSATYDVVCNDADRALEITFPWGLPADSYSVSLANVEPKNGLSDGTASASFEVTEGSAAYMTNVALKGSVDGGELLNLVGGNAQDGEITISEVDTVQITAEIGGCDTACAFLAVYDADWKLIDCVAATKDNNIFAASIDGLTAGTTKHARFFIWKDVETLEPLFRPLECL